MSRKPSASLVLSGWLGVVLALVSLPFLSSGVSSDVWNYPLPGGVHVLVSVLLVLDHLLTGHGFIGLAELQGLGNWARNSLRVSAVGFILLAGCEAVSGALVGSDVEGSPAVRLGYAFGMVSLLIAVPTALAGIAVLRGRLLTGSASISLLASGLILLVGVTAANITGDPIARAVALALWSFTFVWAGRALATHARAATSEPLDRAAMRADS